MLTKNHDRMVDDLDSLVERLELPVVRFKAKESKESIARPFQLALADEGTEGLVLVGKAQERQSVWVGYKDDAVRFGTCAAIPTSASRASRGCPTRGTSTSGTTSGAGGLEAGLQCPLSIVRLGQRPRMAQAPARPAGRGL